MHTVEEYSKRQDRAGKRRYGGFTLIELLIVMSLVTVLGLTTAPFFLRATEIRRVRNEVETLAQSMRLARFRAVAMNRAVYFNVEPAGADDFYTAYANLGDPGDVPTGTAPEIAATRIEFSDSELGWRGKAFADVVEFGTGAAGTTPFGGTLVGAVDLPTNPIVFERRGTVAWPDTLNSLWGAVYVRHEDRNDLVWAIGVSRSGGIRVWRWRDGGWE
jgi:prepilin-type N-terminal cleavage/methylation domain-containing protein